ncbi:hypothetical protein XM38_047940 [Halomicronema hongdechloris C2206]|uniref:HEAT repeat domain-containing protein n=1 Tax=Halomicronema hongdechloris C2206 TaxID=1641165 RepID=A0A1Z3HU31_9CYAN|nr:HEAT repeat domain-containing protein [Halomicronema hongdechloris]ASC73821.1 hypothetical protein XM38_047940 [Halomicronema hongdechloris C2206]
MGIGGFILGIVIGAVLAAAIVYWLQQATIRRQAATLQRQQRRLDQLEREHEHRLQVATERLRWDYEARLASDPATAVATAPSASASPPASAATAATPTPASAPAASPSTTLPVSVTTPLAELTAASYADDAHLRQQVAATLSEAVAVYPPQDRQQCLPLLKRLSRDPDPQVRRVTVEALGRLRSRRALPWLRRALQDANADVVQAAHAAISQFKGRSGMAVAKRRRLPKNH